MSVFHDKPYLDLLRFVLEEGHAKSDRTGVGTLSRFGYQMRFDLSEALPLLTTKKIHIPSVVYELLWFLRGETNVRWLQERGVTIWDEWADKNGDLGPVYGSQWRKWPNWVKEEAHAEGSEWVPERMVTRPIDQIALLIEGIRKSPDSRRHIVSAWNPSEVGNMALPPCHALFQFYVAGGRISCQLYQRSCDVFLGVPFNIASYALLTHMVAAQTGYLPGEFIWTGGDVHLYKNHLEHARLQLSREMRPSPRLTIARVPEKIEDFAFEDLSFEGYDPHPGIKAPIAV